MEKKYLLGIASFQSVQMILKVQVKTARSFLGKEMSAQYLQFHNTKQQKGDSKRGVEGSYHTQMKIHYFESWRV